jgi:hypothetical protein
MVGGLRRNHFLRHYLRGSDSKCALSLPARSGRDPYGGRVLFVSSALTGCPFALANRRVPVMHNSAGVAPFLLQSGITVEEDVQQQEAMTAISGLGATVPLLACLSAGL